MWALRARARHRQAHGELWLFGNGYGAVGRAVVPLWQGETRIRDIEVGTAAPSNVTSGGTRVKRVNQTAEARPPR